MALIECRRCKKKYSDTVSICVHCGCDQSEDYVSYEDVSVIAEIPEKKNTEGQSNFISEITIEKELISDDSKSITDEPCFYHSLTSDKKKELEDEFLSHNPTALKFYKTHYNLKVFSFWETFLFLGTFMVFVFLYMLLKFGFPINNYLLYPYVPILALLIAIFAMLSLVITKILLAAKYSKRKLKSFNATYEKWLIEEKNIIKKV